MAGIEDCRTAYRWLLDNGSRGRGRLACRGAWLQTWDHMVHVWKICHPGLAEGREALEEIRKFLAAT